MELITTLSQIVIAASILIVWVFRFDNIVIEFNHFGLPDLLRSVVGAAKIAMATLLVAGIWYPALILVPSGVIAFLMLCALYALYVVRHWYMVITGGFICKYVPLLDIWFLCVV